MEFACGVAGSKFILVLGHTKCGAIKGACDHVEMGNLTALLSKIQPAVDEEKQTGDNRTSANAEFVENVSEINVKRNVQEILNRSSILSNLVEEGKIGIAGAMYDVGSGDVTFYEDTCILKQPSEKQQVTF
jgi:carbonic anhydrase